MTQQGWSDVMYWGRQSGGGWVVYVFFILILILSFFLFQLIVVFVIVNYSKSQRKGGRERGNEGGREGEGMSLSQRGKVGREGGKEEGREKRVMVVSRKKSVVIPLVGEEEEGEEGREGGVLQEQLKRVKSGDYSELLISKLLAIKAGAQLEALTALPPSLPPSSSIGKGEGGREGGVNVRVGEIALLLQRAMRHLQLAPQHSLSPSSFRLKETGEDEEDDPLLLRKNGGRTRKGGRKGGEVDPSSVKYEESPGTYICAAIARSRSFYYFGHFITILSTLLLSLAHYGMSPSLSRFLTRMNNFLVLIFCLEVFVKARGWGWRRYKEEEGGVGLDLFVVVVSLLELFLGGTSSRSYALRCVRLVRIFSLGREWGGFRKVLGNVVYTASNSVPFLLLLGTFLSVFAIGGMTFLGGKLVDSDGLAALPVPARRNFDSFYWSVVSVFQIMTLDGWNSEMYKAMSVSDSAIAAGFYVSAVLLGKYGLLNLLTAILVENYGRLQEEEEEEEEEGEGGREGGVLVRGGGKEGGEGGRERLPPMWVYVWRRLPFRKYFAKGSSSSSSSSSKKSLCNRLWPTSSTSSSSSTTTTTLLRIESLPPSLPPSSSVRDLNDSNSSSKHAPPSPSSSSSSLPPSLPPSGAGSAPSQLPLLKETDDENEDEDEDEEGREEGSGSQTTPSSKRKSGTALALCYRCLPPFLPRYLTFLDAAFLRIYSYRYFPSFMIWAVVSSCVVLALDCPGPTGLGPPLHWRVGIHTCEALFLGEYYIYLFIYLFIYLLIYLLIFNLFIYSCVCVFVCGVCVCLCVVWCLLWSARDRTI